MILYAVVRRASRLVCYLALVPSPRDRSRLPLLLGASLGTILLLLWWGRGVREGTVGQLQVLDRPEGTEVVLSLLRVISIEEEGYVVGQGTLRVPVRGPTEHLRVGEEITVGGRVEGDAVRASWVEPAPGRPAKRALGLLGLAIAGGLLLASVKPTRRGLLLRG